METGVFRPPKLHDICSWELFWARAWSIFTHKLEIVNSQRRHHDPPVDTIVFELGLHVFSLRRCSVVRRLHPMGATPTRQQPRRIRKLLQCLPSPYGFGTWSAASSWLVLRMLSFPFSWRRPWTRSTCLIAGSQYTSRIRATRRSCRCETGFRLMNCFLQNTNSRGDLFGRLV